MDTERGGAQIREDFREGRAQRGVQGRRKSSRKEVQREGRGGRSSERGGGKDLPETGSEGTALVVVGVAVS